MVKSGSRPLLVLINVNFVFQTDEVLVDVQHINNNEEENAEENDVEEPVIPFRPETCDSGVDLSTTGASSDGEVEGGAGSEAECLDGGGVVNKFLTLPPKLDIKQIDWDELDELLQV